jgi:hypothetical protein
LDDFYFLISKLTTRQSDQGMAGALAPQINGLEASLARGGRKGPSISALV